MKYSTVVFVATCLLIATASPITEATPQADYGWELLCGGNVLAVTKKLRAPKGKGTVVFADSIQLCKKHVYQFSGKSGQKISLDLSGEDGIDMILTRKAGDRVFYLARKWEGTLPGTSRYSLTIVTEQKMAKYSVELKFE